MLSKRKNKGPYSSTTAKAFIIMALFVLVPFLILGSFYAYGQIEEQKSLVRQEMEEQGKMQVAVIEAFVAQAPQIEGMSAPLYACLAKTLETLTLPVEGLTAVVDGSGTMLIGSEATVLWEKARTEGKTEAFTTVTLDEAGKKEAYIVWHSGVDGTDWKYYTAVRARDMPGQYGQLWTMLLAWFLLGFSLWLGVMYYIRTAFLRPMQNITESMRLVRQGKGCGRRISAGPSGAAELDEIVEDFNILLGLLEEQAQTDPLTGLLNRAGCEKKAQERLMRMMPSEMGALMIVDVDNFKEINDSFGHLLGDDSLRMLASALRRFFRESDILCRWGGDEIVILATGISDREWFLRRVLKLFSGPLNNAAEGFTISGGITFFTGGNQQLETLYREADEALYKAKAQGKECLRVFN